MDKKTVAVFDFDGTFIKTNSLPRFLWYFDFPLIFMKKSVCSIPLLMKYAFKKVDNHEAKEKVFQIFFKGMKKEIFYAES